MVAVFALCDRNEHSHVRQRTCDERVFSKLLQLQKPLLLTLRWTEPTARVSPVVAAPKSLPLAKRR